jgi:hypothetical protein
MSHTITIPGSFSFTTAITTFVRPEYDQYDDLTTLPGGYSTFGTVSFGGGGMACQSVGSGITAPHANPFSNGLLVDVEVLGSPSVGEAKIFEVTDTNNKKASVFVDFGTKEIWLGDGTNTPKPGYKPLLRETSFFMRVTVSEFDGNLIARLYTSKTSSLEPPLLQQTVVLVDDPDPPTIGTGLYIGRLTGSNDITFRNLGTLAGEDPDTYYPFPQIETLSPTVSKIEGGDNMDAILDELIDIELGSENLRTIDNIELSSTGSGVATLADGKITLGAAGGLGTAEAQFINSFNGDIPSGADISIDVEVGQALINAPPQQEVVLAAVELRAGGQTVALELASNITNRAFFRIISRTETTTLLSSILLTTTSNTHTIRFIRAGTQIIVLVNGSEVIGLTFREGIGLYRIYSDCSLVPLTYETYFTNFVVRPVLIVGENIASV